MKFYLNKNGDEEMAVNISQRYFQAKVEGYKGQDRTKARETDSLEYVDVEWMMDRTNSSLWRSFSGRWRRNEPT